MTIQHSFTTSMLSILREEFGEDGDEIFDRNELLQYLNVKTRSVSRGSKSRGSFGNLYAIYVLVEDYIANKFDESGDYSNYEGARFTVLFRRQREFLFASKLQNHALNHRLNQEFR